MKYCQICGKELNDTDEFCIYCGMKYKEEKNSAVIKKVYLIIALSALAVGVVGMGLFVLNHTKKNEQIDNNIRNLTIAPCNWG